MSSIPPTLNIKGFQTLPSKLVPYLFINLECQHSTILKNTMFLEKMCIEAHVTVTAIVTAELQIRRRTEDNPKIIFLISKQKHVVTPH